MPASRLLNTGSLLVNNSIDEASLTAGSIAFNGTSQNLTISSSGSAINFTGAYTVECFFYLTSNLTYLGSFGVYAGRLLNGQGNGAFEIAILSASSGTTVPTVLSLSVYGGGPGISATGLTIPINSWNHVAFVRNASNVTTIYLNGISVTSGTISYSYASLDIAIGATNSPGYYGFFPGLISNLRVVKGTAVYTANFTPPQSILPAITNTTLLLNVTDSTNFIKDNSTSNFTVTNNGTTPWSYVGPFNNNPITGGAIVCAGSSQYLYSTVNPAALQMGTGDYTIEFWIYPTTAGTYTLLEIGRPTNNASVCINFNINSSGIYFYGATASLLISGTTPVVLNTWSHIALTRASSSTKLFLNGTQTGSTVTDATNYNQANLWVGTNAGNAPGGVNFPGWLSGIRAIKGTALYTSNFTVPTTPPTAITNTVLLLNAVTSATIATDSSSTNLAITNAGATWTAGSPYTIVPTVKQRLLNSGTLEVPEQFDEASLIAGAIAFNGTNQYLSYTNTTALQMGTGDYTIEFWIYQTSFSTAQVLLEIGRLVPGATPVIQFDTTTGGVITFYGGTGTLLITASAANSLNTWYHVAVSRNSSNTKLFINGVQSGSTATDSTNYNQAYLWVGANAGGASAWLNGYMSNLRVVKGTSIYNANFTPPQAILPAITNTQLLLNVANSTNFIKDNSTNNFALTNTGASAWTAAGPFNGISILAASMIFNGSSQYVSYTNTTNLQMGTGDYTIEFWIYQTNFAAAQVLLEIGRLVPGATPVIQFDTTTGGVITFYGGTGTLLITASAANSLNTWYHVAVSRNSSNTKLFINGVQSGSTATDSTNYNQAYLWIGVNAGGASAWLNGWLSGLRVLKGTALYTSNFTAPTAPLTAIANTQLLLNSTSSTNVVTDSSPNNFALSTNAGPLSWTAAGPYAQPTPTVKQRQLSTGTLEIPEEFDELSLNAGSILFNGSTQYLSVPNSTSLDFGNSDFTVECWVYIPNGTVGNSIEAIFSKRVYNGFVVSVTYNASTFQQWLWIDNTSISTFNSGNAIPTGSWVHLAWVRSGTTFTTYINGVLNQTSTISITASTQNTTTYFGGDPNYGQYFKGYISNYRILKGTALYSSNFTPQKSILSSIANTQILLNVTDSTNFIKDTSPNNFTLTNNGTATWDASGPFN